MVAGQAISERRSRPRMPLRHCRARIRRCPWRLWIPSGQEAITPVLNLSLGGMAIVGRHHYRLGEHVLATLYPKGQARAARARLTVRGRVAWCVAPGSGTRELVGIQFVGRSAALHRRITDWAARHRHLLA